MKKIISICIPVYNEEDNINIITKEIESFFLKIDKLYDYEIIFSNNCSLDKTLEIINQCKKKIIKLDLLISTKISAMIYLYILIY